MFIKVATSYNPDNSQTQLIDIRNILTITNEGSNEYGKGATIHLKQSIKDIKGNEVSSIWTCASKEAVEMMVKAAQK